MVHQKTTSMDFLHVNFFLYFLTLTEIPSTTTKPETTAMTKPTTTETTPTTSKLNNKILVLK